MIEIIHIPDLDPFPDAYQHWLRDQEIDRQELLAELEWIKRNPDLFDSDDR